MIDLLVSLLIPCLPALVAAWALVEALSAPAGPLQDRARSGFLLAFLVPAILFLMVDVRLVFWSLKGLERDSESAALSEFFVSAAAILSLSLLVLLPLVSLAKHRLARRDIPWIASVTVGTIFYLGYLAEVGTSFTLGEGLGSHSVIAGVALVIAVLTIPRVVHTREGVPER